MTNSQLPISPGSYPDLDYRFLRYIGVTLEGEAQIHRIYVPMLAGCRQVVDLGCGLGGFVQLLRDAGIDAYGVDADPQCAADAQAHGIPVVVDDVLHHLRTLAPATLDGVFSAHLVEHLPYPVVIELIELAFRALRPGGRLLLATPNPRALVSHLEMYTMHFGHVAMYHPNLLAYFMDYAGFVDVTHGENAATAASAVAGLSPLVQLDGLAPRLRAVAHAPSPQPTAHLPATQVIPQPANLLRRGVWRLKMALIHWLVQPYYDRLGTELAMHSAVTAHSAAAAATEVAAVRDALTTTLDAVQRPFESYVLGHKPVV